MISAARRKGCLKHKWNLVAKGPKSECYNNTILKDTFSQPLVERAAQAEKELKPTWQ